MLIRNAEINGEHCADVRIANKKITEISGSLTELTGEQIIHANGGALFPGLHDHHIHLTALAARMNSVDCGPSIVTSVEDLKQMLRNATADNTGWIRGIGYHESVAGHLNKHDLDQIVADVPIRIQHRSGRLWMMNSAAVDRLLAAAKIKPVAYNEFLKTGRLADDDAWLRAITARGRPPSLVTAVQLLLSFGVTGITDTTPDNCGADLARFERARQARELPCKVRLMGTEKTMNG